MVALLHCHIKKLHHLHETKRTRSSFKKNIFELRNPIFLSFFFFPFFNHLVKRSPFTFSQFCDKSDKNLHSRQPSMNALTTSQRHFLLKKFPFSESTQLRKVDQKDPLNTYSYSTSIDWIAAGDEYSIGDED